MDANRIWLIGAAFVTAVIVVLGWLLGIQPQLDAAASAAVQRAGVASTNAAYEAALTKLEADNKNLPAMKDQLAALAASVPSDPHVPAFVDEVNALAAKYGVVVANIKSSDALPYTPVKPATPAATSTASGTSTATPTPSPSSGSSSSSSTPAPVPTSTAGVPPVTNPLITPTSFAAIPVQFSITGDSPNILNFVRGLQTAKRLFLVVGLTTSVPAPGSTVIGVQATVSGLIYVVPAAEKVPVGAG